MLDGTIVQAQQLDAASPRSALDTLLTHLKAEGVTVVFGIPGGLLYPFFDAVEHDEELRLIVTKHEEGAAFMADGFARTSHRLAVCAATSGPGATNLLTGVACAFADGVPMLVLTGQAASRAMGRGAAQEAGREDIDIVAMFRPVTKYSAMVTSAQGMSHHVRRAMRLALSGRPGPVHLNVPVEVWAQTTDEDWFEPGSYRVETRGFDRRAVLAAGRALSSGRRPVILAGAGTTVARATEPLRALAELLPARVATTPRGKGVFPEDHELSLGVLGLAGHRAAGEIVLGDDVDVLLTVGASLNETSTLGWDPRLRPSKTLIQADIDPDRIGRSYPIDVALVGDAQAILSELVDDVRHRRDQGAPVCSIWGSTPPATAGEGRYDHPELRGSRAHPLTPQRWRVELQAVLPDDVILFSDVGGHMLFNLHDLEIRERQRFVLNLGFGSMGHGTVAPIGAALANPGRPVVAIVGDACFTMNGMDLLTAREYDVPVVWIVENNDMHGVTWHASDKVSDRRRKLESVRYRCRVPVAAVARAMGLAAFEVERAGELAARVDEVMRRRVPAVIEVHVDPAIVPPLGARARSLAGFIKR